MNTFFLEARLELDPRIIANVLFSMLTAFTVFDSNPHSHRSKTGRKLFCRPDMSWFRDRFVSLA
jgi:hypothetical protein